jgi:hypothetical protein
MSRFLPAVFVVALLAAPDASAQPAGGQIPQSVKTGLQVTIVAEDGEQIEGRVTEVTNSAVRVSLRKAIEEVPIDRIVRIEQQDSLKNGALLGLTLGAVTGAIAGSFEEQDRARWMIVNGIGNGLFWMAIGIGIDALNDNRRLLYERRGVQTRIGLSLGRKSTGAMVSMSW